MVFYQRLFWLSSSLLLVSLPWSGSSGGGCAWALLTPPSSPLGSSSSSSSSRFYAKSSSSQAQAEQTLLKDTSRISISCIEPSTSLSSTDIHNLQALADVRYQEWMMTESAATRPSRTAFGRATAEIQQERVIVLDDRTCYGAVPFVARYETVTVSPSEPVPTAGTGFGSGGTGNRIGKIPKKPRTTTTTTPTTSTTTTTTTTFEVVGAAELSPLEFEDCFDEKDDHSDPMMSTKMNLYRNKQYWYVTDVVTAQQHRRQGVAAALLKALEEYALQANGGSGMEKYETVLLMHVEPDNEGALKFYERHGYQRLSSPLSSSSLPPPSTSTVARTSRVHDGGVVWVDYLTGVDVEKLAENAGVSGQWLLGKQL